MAVGLDPNSDFDCKREWFTFQQSRAYAFLVCYLEMKLQRTQESLCDTKEVDDFRRAQGVASELRSVLLLLKGQDIRDKVRETIDYGTKR